MGDMSRWRAVGAGFLSGSGYDSRGDLWEHEVVSDGTVLKMRIRTKKAFAITPSTLFFIAYLYDQPERYLNIRTNESIIITSLTNTGLASGVLVAPVTSMPQPNLYNLTIGAVTSLTATGMVTASNCYGWVIGVNASGNETISGATSVTFHAAINLSDFFGIDVALLALNLSGRGGCCDIHLPAGTNASITKPDANLREVIEQSTDEYAQVRYHRKRFIRDRALPTIDFRADSPLVWRFPETTRAVDISKAPNRVYGQYRGYWTGIL
jgi:hypothetical protein